MNLSEFLLARIAEDEAVAQTAVADLIGDGRDTATREWFITYGSMNLWPSHLAHIARHDPVRVLRRCEADRRIVEMHAANSTAYPPRFDQFDPHSITVCASCGESREPFHKPGCTTLRLLALPYADHPDYDERWRA